MARLIYTAITSLDGYTSDADGNFDWNEPDDEVHARINALERPFGTYLYGRRLYETMAAWETVTEGPAVAVDYAQLWRAADKIVYSTTLPSVTTARTTLARTFDPAAVRALTAASDRDLTIGGAGLAAHALRSALIDEVRVFISPIVVGGGTPYLPADLRLDLDLAEEHTFTSGVVYLRYTIRPRAPRRRVRVVPEVL